MRIFHLILLILLIMVIVAAVLCHPGIRHPNLNVLTHIFLLHEKSER